MMWGSQYSSAYNSSSEAARQASNDLLASAAAAVKAAKDGAVAVGSAAVDGAVAIGKGAVSIPVSVLGKGGTYVLFKVKPVFQSAKDYFSPTNGPASNAVISCPLPVVNSTFRDKFQKMAGMSLDESIKYYKDLTGKDLDPRQVQKMFNDATYARDLMLADKDIHTTYRDILNTNIPKTIEDARLLGYTKLSVLESIYHNPVTDMWKNTKYISADGHLEAVYDEHGKLVDSNDFKGTFNFFGPKQKSEHAAADVETYAKWGN